MKGKVEKKEFITVNRTLTGILAATMVMSNVSGTGLVVQAEESSTQEIVTEESIIEILTEMETESLTESHSQEDGLEENATEEVTIEENATEEITTGELSGEELLFASVYLELHSNGGSCDVSMLELTPEHMELELPQPQKAGYHFTGWYVDADCTIAFDKENIFWEAGSTYTLFAGYEQIQSDEIVLIERILQQNVQGVTITVEGNMPAEATLKVQADALTLEEQENIVEESDIVDSTDSLNTDENTVYSYDISICYKDVEYEPYLFDERMEVTFSFDDAQELQAAQQIEVFHIDDAENIEKIEIKEVSESKVSFEANAFSTYILITKVEFTGNKNWTYGFTGDVQTFTAPVSGQYIFECYGAGTTNSKGSFAKGTIGLEKDETIYIYVGGQNDTFNGGGNGGAVWHSASNSGGSFNRNVYSDHGCGATDVRVGAGLESRLIVAGGGSGDGHRGGVVYSYNGSTVSDGPTYSEVKAKNEVKSNEVLGQGSDYGTSVSSGVWGTGDSYPDRGTYSTRTVTGGDSVK